MTGFGAGRAASRAGVAEVEVRSVNSRYLDIRVNLPRELAGLEGTIRERVKERVTRGQVTVQVAVSPARKAEAYVLDENVLARAAAQLRRAARVADVSGEITMDTLLRIPGVIRSEEPILHAPALGALVCAALERALNRLLAARRREGVVLTRDLMRRARRVGREFERVARVAPRVVARVKRRLAQRIDEMAKECGVETDRARLAIECGLAADRVDITEELTRARSHLEQLEAALRGEESAGRRIDFLLQELFREATTAGNKANCAEIANHVVTIKEELEKMREQAQNIE
ncbi:MAG: YicC family protein [bacterium]|nr:YicC family protein [bacterium]